MTNSRRILDGASELFFQAGIKSVTMDDIAKHLGMSKKTLYLHFADKNELVIALVKTRMQEDKEQMAQMLNESENIIEQMVKMMKCSEEVLARMNPILIHDLQKYHPEGWKEIQNFKSETITNTLEALLTEGIKEGYIRPEIDVKIMARLRMALIESGFNLNLFPTTEFSPWKVQQQFLEHFNYGICTLIGYKLLNQYQNPAIINKPIQSQTV